MWYAIRTEIGQEEIIREKISKCLSEGNGGNCRVLYCVKKKRYLGQWHDKRESFLPGYVFLVIEEKDREIVAWPVFLENYGERLGIDKKLISYVKKEDERFLTELTIGKDEIGMSYGIIENGVLKIYRGALIGMESKVRKIDRHKRKGYISMKFDNEEKMTEIGLEITAKIFNSSNIYCHEEKHTSKENI